MTTPQELKQIVSEGLLSFPVTDFDEQGDFRADTYAERLEWLAPYGASALFVAGGTGEFFSLTHNDYSNVVKTAAEVCKGKVPILAGAAPGSLRWRDPLRWGWARDPSWGKTKEGLLPDMVVGVVGW